MRTSIPATQLMWYDIALVKCKMLLFQLHLEKMAKSVLQTFKMNEFVNETTMVSSLKLLLLCPRKIFSPSMRTWPLICEGALSRWKVLWLYITNQPTNAIFKHDSHAYGSLLKTVLLQVYRNKTTIIPL